MINLRHRLSIRIHKQAILELIKDIQSQNLQQELYDLLFDSDDFISYQALWVFTHFPAKEHKWLYDKLNDLIDEVIICQHHGKRRLLLTLIYRQPLKDVSRVDFIDFCLERMISPQELPAIHSVCMKIAYELCLPHPELMHELKMMFDIVHPQALMPSSKAARKSVLKAMETGVSLQAKK